MPDATEQKPKPGHLLASRAFTIARRSLFVAALLLVPSFAAVSSELLKSWDNPAFSPAVLFVSGMGGVYLLVSTWLATREGALRSWSGWIRVTIYTLALSYGGMMAIHFAIGYHKPGFYLDGFRLPGGQWQDYGMIVLWLISTWACALVLIPIARLFRVQLVSVDKCLEKPANWSIGGVLGYMALFGLLLGLVGIQSQEWAPRLSQLDVPTRAEAWQEFFRETLPMAFVRALSVAILLLALSRSWWLGLISLALVVPLEYYSTHLVMPSPPTRVIALHQIAGPSFYAYVAGCWMPVYFGLKVALALGIRLQSCFTSRQVQGGGDQ